MVRYNLITFFLLLLSSALAITDDDGDYGGTAMENRVMGNIILRPSIHPNTNLSNVGHLKPQPTVKYYYEGASSGKPNATSHGPLVSSDSLWLRSLDP